MHTVEMAYEYNKDAITLTCSHNAKIPATTPETT